LTVAGLAQAQTRPTLKLLASDQSSLTLSNNFGVPAQADVNQAGDYAFAGADASALFFRSATAATTTRLLQRNEAVPGIPGVQSDFFQPFRLNSAGHIAVQVVYNAADPRLNGSAILLYDGSAFHTVVISTDLAPGGGGANYGNVNLVGLNDTGDIAFVAPLRSSTGTNLNRPTLYIVPAGGSPMRIIGFNDAAPGLAGSTILNISGLSFNNLGQVLFRSGVSGGAGGNGLFLGSTAGVQKVVATGDPLPAPASGAFGAGFGTRLLNNVGQVAFGPTLNAFWLFTPGIGLTRLAGSGDPVPAPSVDLGGALGALRNSLALNDSGTVAFISAINGNSGNGNFNYNNVLFRLTSGTLQSVANSNQTPPGTTGTFNNFDSISINNSGKVSFHGNIAGGTAGSGLFTQSPNNPLTAVALDGDTVPIAGSGTFRINGGRTVTLDNGSIYAWSDVLGGAADYWEFVNSAGAFRTLMTTADTLPPDSLVWMRTYDVGTAGDFAGIFARKNAGMATVFVVRKTTSVITRVAGEGDPAPGSNGGHLRYVAINGVAVNASGQVALFPTIVGGVGGDSAAYLWDPIAGLRKVAVNGDMESVTNAPFVSISGNDGYYGVPLNDAGQVVFTGSLANGRDGIFVGSAGGIAAAVALTGDFAPGGGTFSSFINPWNVVINQAGQVAFSANTSLNVSGLFLGNAGGSPSKIVAGGDAGPSGSTFAPQGVSSAYSLNNHGEVLFSASLNGGPGGGLFVGTTEAPPQPIALNGSPAPSGGSFTNIFTSAEDGLIDDQHDVAFRASLMGGSADSGIFLRRGPYGVLQTVLLQGQSAPGTSGTFATMPSGVNGIAGEYLALAPSGELFLRTLVQTSWTLGAWYRYRTNDVLEKVVIVGDPAPNSGGGIISAIGPHAWPTPNPGLWMIVLGGTFKDAIYSVESVSADLAMTPFGPEVTDLGVPATYTYVITNNGPFSATGVTLHVPFPANAIVTDSNGCTVTSVVTCNLGTLAVGGSASVSLSFTATSGPSLNFAAASVSSSEPDPDDTNNHSGFLTTVRVPALSIAKTADAPGVTAGQTIGFAITVSNSAAPETSQATGVTINDPLPAGPGVMWNISPPYNGPGSCGISGATGSQTLNCFIGNLHAGSSASVHVSSATGFASARSYSNTATASASYVPPITASATTNVMAPALSLAKTADAASVAAGAAIGFTIAVSNHGSAGTGWANNVAISDPLPAVPGVAWSINPVYSGPGTCSITGTVGSQILNCSIGSLPAGAGASVHVTGTTTFASSGTYSNTAVVSASNAPGMIASATTTVQTAPPHTDIAVSVAGPSSAVVKGQNATFITTVTNRGPLGTTVTVSETLPPTLSLVSANFMNNGTPGSCSVAGPQLTCAVGSMPYSGTPATATITVVATTSQTGFYSLTANATGTLPDPDPANSNGKGTALVALTPNAAERLINVDNGLGTVHLYNPATLTEITTPPPAFGAGMRTRPVVLPNGRLAFLRGSSYISVVDLSIKAEIYRIPIFPQWNMALTPDGSTLVVPLIDQVALVNTATFQVTTVALNGLVGDDPSKNDIALGGAVIVGSNVYFNPSGFQSGSTTVGLPIIVVNLNTYVVSTIAVSGARGMTGPNVDRTTLAATPDGRYLAASRSNNLTIIDLTTKTVLMQNTSPGVRNREVAIVRDLGNPNVFAYLITADTPTTTVVDLRTGSPTFGQVVASGGTFPPENQTGNFLPVLSGDGATLLTFDFWFTIFKTNTSTLAITQNFIAMDENSFNLAVVDLTPVAGAPTVSSVQPRAMVNDTATTVIVNGTNFASDAHVRFGQNVPLPTTFLSSSQLQITIPAGVPAQDNMDVIVTNPNSAGAILQQNVSGVLRGGFTALPPTSWQPAHPLVGVTVGDTSISVVKRSESHIAIPQSPLTSASFSLFSATSAVSPDGAYAFTGINNITGLTTSNAGVAITNLSTGAQTFTELSNGMSQLVRSVNPSNSASVIYVADVNNTGEPQLRSIDANPASGTFGSILTTIPSGIGWANLLTLAVTPDGRWVFLNTANGSPAPGRQILIFDTLAGARVGSMDPGALGLPNNIFGMTVTPDGSSLLVQMANTSTIAVFDLTGNPASPTLLTTISGVIPVGNTNIVLDSYVVFGSRLFATGYAYNFVPGAISTSQPVLEVFNFNRGTSTFTPLVTYNLPASPLSGGGILLSADGSQIYVVSYSESQILALDTAKVLANDPTALITRIQTNFGPGHYVVSPAPSSTGLSLSLNASPNPVLIGHNVSFGFTIQNNGPVPATSILLQDTLPVGMTLVSASCNGGACSCNNSSPISCWVSSIPSGNSVTGTIVATAPSSPGTLNTTATALASNFPVATASASVTVLAPSLSIVKTADTPTVSAGTAIGFTITVSNSAAAGGGMATSVGISDPLPAGPGLSWSISPAYSGPGTCSITGAPGSRTLNCSLADLTPGASVSVHVASPTSFASAGSYSNTATASAGDTPSVNASASITVQAPGLNLVKTADASTVSAGTAIGFTVTVSNNAAPGIGTAAGVAISDPLPAGPGVTWTLSPAYTGLGACAISGAPGNQTLNCSIGSLAPNASASVHVSGTTSFASAGSYPNTATASASNAPAVTASATTAVRAPALSILKTADAAAVSAGAAIGFTITVSNSAAAGTDTAAGVTINDPLPAGPGVIWNISPAYGGPGTCAISGISWNQTLDCSIGSLAPGASASVHVTSTTSFASAGSYANTATASVSNAPAISASATTTVRAPALSLATTADAEAVSAGTAIGFTITVSNSAAAGTGTAGSVTISDPLPAGYGLLWSISPAYSGPGTCALNGDAGNQTLVCSIGSLAPGASVSVHVISPTSFASATIYSNTATASASNAPSTYDSAGIAVEAPALSIVNAADASAVSAGVPIGFTITVSNSAVNGTGTATIVSINSPLPAGSGVTWTISPAYGGPGTCSITGAAGSQVLNCALGNLASGASASVHLGSATSLASVGSYSNAATASASNAPSIHASASIDLQAPALSITTTADASAVSAGAAIGFTITASNSAASGTGTVTSVTISDPLPAGSGVTWNISPAYGGPGTCSLTGATGSQTLNCALISLASGASASVHVASATSLASAGSYTNTATAGASNALTVSASAITAVQAPVLSIANIADASPVGAGTVIGFTIVVSNNALPGTGTAANVTVTDALPVGSGVSWSITPAYGGPGTCAITGATGSQALSCALGTLAPGDSAIVHVTSATTVSSIGNYSNTAAVSASNASLVNASAGITVQAPAPMSLLPSPIAFDSQLIYSGKTIVVTLTNGSLPITITSISLTGVFTQSNNCPTALAGGASCTIIVWFQPTSLGPQSGTLSVYHSGSGSPLQSQISGTATDLTMAMSRIFRSSRSDPNHLAVGRAQLIPIVLSAGGASANVVLQCSAPARISCYVQPSSVELNGMPKAANVVVQSDSSGGATPGMYTLKVSADAGTQTSSLALPIELVAESSLQTEATITAATASPVPRVAVQSAGDQAGMDAPAQPQRIVSAPALPALVASPIRLEFDSEATKGNAVRSVKVTNPLTVAQKISSINVTGDFLQEGNCGAELQGGASCEIQVSFRPSVPGKYIGELTITTSAGSATVKLFGPSQ
jgi:uncharacterized repeat protein (TIGR01451 family)